MPRQAKHWNCDDLMQIAVTACRNKRPAIQRNLSDPSSQVLCKCPVHAFAFVAEQLIFYVPNISCRNLLRYLGVECGKGGFDPNLLAMSSSKLGFEWCVGTGAERVREVVVVRCDNAILRGVPAPVAVGKIQSCTVDLKPADLEALAAAAVAPEKCQAIRRNLGDPSMQVICQCLHQMEH